MASFSLRQVFMYCLMFTFFADSWAQLKDGTTEAFLTTPNSPSRNSTLTWVPRRTTDSFPITSNSPWRSSTLSAQSATTGSFPLITSRPPWENSTARSTTNRTATMSLSSTKTPNASASLTFTIGASMNSTHGRPTVDPTTKLLNVNNVTHSPSYSTTMTLNSTVHPLVTATVPEDWTIMNVTRIISAKPTDHKGVWMISLIVLISCMILCLIVGMSRRCARKEVGKKNRQLLFGRSCWGLSGVTVMTIDDNSIKNDVAVKSQGSTRSSPPSYETVVAPGYIPAGNNFLVAEPGF